MGNRPPSPQQLLEAGVFFPCGPGEPTDHTKPWALQTETQALSLGTITPSFLSWGSFLV